MANPGDVLRLTDENSRNLAGYLKEIVSQLEAQRSLFKKRVDTWWNWYEAKPQFETRSDPWPKASNVVIPLIRTHADAIHARYVNTIFAGHKIWHGKTGNEDFKEKYFPHIPDYWNWAGSGNEFDMLYPTLDAIGEMVPIGASVFGLRYERRERYIFLPGRNGRSKAERVTLSRGPVIEHIPIDQCLWQDGRPVHESEFFIKQSLLTWSDIARQVQTGGWDAEAAEHVRKSPNSAVSERLRSTLESEGISVEGAAAYNLYDIRECWMDWPFAKGLSPAESGNQDPTTPSVPIVVTFSPDSGKILRVVSHPYAIPGWPFYEIYFRKRPGRGSSPGVAKLLEHPQRAITTMINQAIDAVTLKNAIHSKTTDPKLKNLKLSMNQPIYVSQMGDFETIDIGAGIMPDIQLINLLWGMSERLTGISDPMLGRETRMGGHPSPATSTLALLQESSKLFAMGLKQIRKQMSRIGEDSLALKQQFFTEKDGQAIVSALGEKDAQPVIEWLSQGPMLYGNMSFDLHTLSEVHNPQAEMQRAILVDQVVSNFYSRAIQLIQIMAQAEGNQMLQGVVDVALRGLTKSISNVLESAEVDDIDEYLIKMRESNYDPRVIQETGDQLLAARGSVPGGAVVPSREAAVQGAVQRTNAAGSAFGS